QSRLMLFSRVRVAQFVASSRPAAAPLSLFCFFSEPASPAIYTLSLHDALPISKFGINAAVHHRFTCVAQFDRSENRQAGFPAVRSEEHTSELQSRFDLVCRLLLEKKKEPHPNTPPTLAGTSASPNPTRLEGSAL